VTQDAAAQADEWRRRAAEAAIADVSDGMRLGLGTGRTAEHFVRLLGERVRDGLNVVAVATSERTATLAALVGIPVATLDTEPVLDLAIDGADEVDARLRLIKGGGGALLREKIVANAAGRFIVIVDEAKLVAQLGAFPLPVEIVPFGLTATVRAIERALGALGIAGAIVLRTRSDQPFVTDNGNRIVDLHLGRIANPEAVAAALAAIPGVVEHGLFIGMATAAIIAGAGGVRRLSPDRTLS
jgi:ribose 5-phosphate isomerase A